MSSEKAYREIVNIADEVVTGPTIASVGSPLINKKILDDKNDSDTAIGEPKSISSIQLVGSLKKDPNRKVKLKNGTIQLCGEWKYKEKGRIYQIDILGELLRQGDTHNGEVTINGRKYIL